MFIAFNNLENFEAPSKLESSAVPPLLWWWQQRWWNHHTHKHTYTHTPVVVVLKVDLLHHKWAGKLRKMSFTRQTTLLLLLPRHTGIFVVINVIRIELFSSIAVAPWKVKVQGDMLLTNYTW